MYFNSFFDAVDGLAPEPEPLQFRGDDGSIVEHEGPVAISRPGHQARQPGRA